MSGKIILVGAGPGGKGLLTLRGLEALGEADAVVYDRLVSEEILSLIPSSAEKIDAGKSPGSHPVPQPEINRILVEKAEEGKTVVRLKGGDHSSSAGAGRNWTSRRRRASPSRWCRG